MARKRKYFLLFAFTAGSNEMLDLRFRKLTLEDPKRTNILCKNIPITNVPFFIYFQSSS